MNQLILGDNLEILRKMDSESVDLIYLDPPFFINRNYEVIWGDDGEIRYKGFEPPDKGWRYSLETMQRLDEEGRVFFPTLPNGAHDFSKRLRLKRYLDEQKGNLMGDIWADIQAVQSKMAERIGYPTQKPEKLLKRIIEMASNEGDVILDPFVGGGTTIAVANQLNRQWIGIDQSIQAVKISELRLWNLMDLFSKPFLTKLHKYDYDTLRYKDAFEFEQFIVHQMGGTPNLKQRNDLGLDGKTMENVPIQVKRSDNVRRNVIDNFYAAIQRADKRRTPCSHQSR